MGLEVKTPVKVESEGCVAATIAYAITPYMLHVFVPYFTSRL